MGAGNFSREEDIMVYRLPVWIVSWVYVGSTTNLHAAQEISDLLNQYESELLVLSVIEDHRIVHFFLGIKQIAPAFQVDV